MIDRTVHRYGDHALIVDVPSLEHVWALAAGLHRDPPDGVIDVVPAARTVTVLFDPAVLPFETARTWVLGVPEADADADDREPLTIDVVYDGDDLGEVARLLGIERDEVVRRHAEAHWRVAFAGFAPGFGYLVTDDPLPTVPRRPSPRTRVPAGSVALAGEFTGVYPRQGPGGWQLIGRTDAVLWDERRDPPALLTPGRAVRFRPVAARAADGSPSRTTRHTEVSPSGSAPEATSRSVTVVRPGLLTLVEDLGREGMTQYGLARSGALDRGSLRLGNRLVGNPQDAAGLEIMAGDAAVRFDQPSWFAVTGARGPLALSGVPVEPDTATAAREGDVLELGRVTLGLRYLLTVRGGIHPRRVLGSRSRDMGAAVGPSAVAAGDRLPIGPEPDAPIPAIDALTVAPPSPDLVLVHAHPGPRIDWFTSDAIARFFDTAWSVTSESNRIGVRLASPDAALTRVATAELPSEAMVVGSVQVPPSGQPTVLLADHPVTGGYPVIAVVADADLDLFAQLRPGQQVRFRHAR